MSDFEFEWTKKPEKTISTPDVTAEPPVPEVVTIKEIGVKIKGWDSTFNSVCNSCANFKRGGSCARGHTTHTLITAALTASVLKCKSYNLRENYMQSLYRLILCSSIYADYMRDNAVHLVIKTSSSDQAKNTIQIDCKLFYINNPAIKYLVKVLDYGHA